MEISREGRKTTPERGVQEQVSPSEVGGRAQEGRGRLAGVAGRLAGVAGRLAVVRHSEAVTHSYYAPVTLDATLSTEASASLPDTWGMVRITPDHTCTNPS